MVSQKAKRSTTKLFIVGASTDQDFTDTIVFIRRMTGHHALTVTQQSKRNILQ